MKKEELQGIYEPTILTKIRLFYSKKQENRKKIQEKLETIESLPMNKLEYDLIIYERNPFPETAFIKFHPVHVEFLDTCESRYSEGILFEGIIERLEQINQRFVYTVKTKYGHIMAEIHDREKEAGESVKVLIWDDKLFYFDIDENRLNKDYVPSLSS